MTTGSKRLSALPAAPQAMIGLGNIKAYLPFHGLKSFEWPFKVKILIYL